MEQKGNNNNNLKFNAFSLLVASLILFCVTFMFSLDNEGEFYGRKDILVLPTGFLGVVFLGASISMFVRYKRGNVLLNGHVPKIILLGVIFITLCGFSLIFQARPSLTVFNALSGFAGIFFVVIGVVKLVAESRK